MHSGGVVMVVSMPTIKSVLDILCIKTHFQTILSFLKVINL